MLTKVENHGLILSSVSAVVMIAYGLGFIDASSSLLAGFFEIVILIFLTLGFMSISKKEKNNILYWASPISFLIPILFYLIFNITEVAFNMFLLSFIFGLGLMKLKRLGPITKYAGILNIIISIAAALDFFISRYFNLTFFGILTFLYAVKLFADAYILYRAREVYDKK